ncbi:hypothetical protein EV363DRAFT_1447792 [Boletus edulis]|nr:hypothetical protein EV363DRAFT_1447792 [Boletus edulis]
MLVPIACRFVPYDQWLVTHIDDKSKVKQVKHWILSKCNLVQSPGPHSQRSVSPIVFASTVRSRSSIDSLDDGYNEDDEFSDQDLHPLRTPPSKLTTIYPQCDPIPGPSSQLRNCPLVDRYTLLSFSTGTVLEDEFTLSWYNLRPYELLEMHPVGILAPLQRDVLEEYIQPYFQAKVRVLRSMWNQKHGRFETAGVDATSQKTMDKLTHKLDALSTKSTALHPEKRRKTKVDWKGRWVVIHQGCLFLCKDNVTNPPLRQFALSTMSAFRGADALERAFSIVTQPRVVCIKFRTRSTSVTGVASPPPSYPSSPISEELKMNVQEHHDSPLDSKQTRETEDSGEYPYDDAYKEEGEWVVLDMLDDHAFSSILRILHRQTSQPISSSFVPSPSIVTVSHHATASPASSFASYDTIPYPEWRINTVENARKAGMGDVGKAMAWVIWTEKGLGESLLGNIRHHRHAFSEEMQYKTTFAPDIYCGSDDESDEDSEMEWDGWMRDLERQSRVKQQSEKTSKSSVSSRQAHIPSTTSLPSPPLSETSPSGSPRVVSPSLSVSQLYPNIGNVIQASGTRGYRSPERIKNTTISTVSVGMVPMSRRRSSTLVAEMGMMTRREHDKGKEAFARNGARASPSTPVRHARSSSNLRVSSSPYGSDAAESGHPGPSSPPKRPSAFMRGMSLRAGKLVRGLESAIDFVDEKTV